MKEITNEQHNALSNALYNILEGFPQFMRLDIETKEEILRDYRETLIFNIRIDFEF